MHQSPLRILAIHPGTHDMGYAVLDAGELLDNHVHPLTRRKARQSTLAEGQRLVHALIETFDPTFLIIENASHTHADRVSLGHMLDAEIARLVAVTGLHIVSYAPATVKRAITGDMTASTRKVAKMIVHLWYHHLEPYLHTDVPEVHRCWEQMFDAVALGVVAHYDLTKQPLPHPLATASEW